MSLSLCSKRGHRADQIAVWAHLADRASQLGHGARPQAVAAQPGQVGALIYLAGQWVGSDLLAGPGFFDRA